MALVNRCVISTTIIVNIIESTGFLTTIIVNIINPCGRVARKSRRMHVVALVKMSLPITETLSLHMQAARSSTPTGPLARITAGQRLWRQTNSHVVPASTRPVTAVIRAVAPFISDSLRSPGRGNLDVWRQ